jgi:hypothetical protein
VKHATAKSSAPPASDSRATAEASIRNDERKAQEAYFGAVLVKATDIVSEALTILDGEPANVSTNESVELVLRRLLKEIWIARWDKHLCGGSKRIELADERPGVL